MSIVYDKVKQFVFDSFNHGENKKAMDHFERTAFWLQEICPNADEAMLISAYAHDIARAFRDKNVEQQYEGRELNDPRTLEEHQQKGADIMVKFLKEQNYSRKDIDRVYNMIRHHEEGGDKESNFIKDADSISFLEVNALKIIDKFIYNIGKEKMNNKIVWMYERISDNKAKKLAKPFYETAINELGEY